MIRSKSLRVLQIAFDERLLRLEAIAAGGDWQHLPLDRRMAYVTIECLSAWSIFAREYYLSCAWLRARRISGPPVEPASRLFSDERDAILHSIRILKPPTVYNRAQNSANISARDEPTWHEPSTIMKIYSNLRMSNMNEVSASFSYPTTFFNDCPTIRNFFAHRNMGTAQKVYSLARRPPYSVFIGSAGDLVGTLLPGRTQTLAREWIDDLRLISHDLCL